MHRVKSRSILVLSLILGFLLAAVMTGVFFYWRLQARAHDTSGMVLVNMAADLLSPK